VLWTVLNEGRVWHILVLGDLKWEKTDNKRLFLWINLYSSNHPSKQKTVIFQMRKQAINLFLAGIVIFMRKNLLIVFVLFGRFLFYRELSNLIRIN
jgi:hypothetical protein